MEILQPSCQTVLSFQTHNNCFLEINYFFIDAKLISKVSSATYDPNAISDRVPVSLDVEFSPQPCYHLLWSFNTSPLADFEFVDFLSAVIDEFISINQNEKDPVSFGLLWESLKAYIRGQIFAYSAHLNKSHRSTVQRLSNDISALDQQLATCTSTSSLHH